MNIVDFEIELEKLINKYSIENGSNTPDFLLTKYLMGCLHNYNSTVNSRKVWCGESKEISNMSEETIREEIDEVIHPLLSDPMDMNGMYSTADKIMYIFEKYKKL
jgi:hypothetical protein